MILYMEMDADTLNLLNGVSKWPSCGKAIHAKACSLLFVVSVCGANGVKDIVKNANYLERGILSKNL